MLCLSDSIRHDDPAVQQLLRTIEEAHTRPQLILAVWPFARVLARHIIASVLAERAQRPIAWPPCPTCGTLLRSKGFAHRQLTSLVGPIRWRRRVGRCPHGCDIPQVAPFDEILGVQPQQRTKVDWAHFIQELVDQHSPHVEKLRLVMDNLHTHTTASLYEAFDPPEAKSIADK